MKQAKIYTLIIIMFTLIFANVITADEVKDIDSGITWATWMFGDGQREVIRFNNDGTWSCTNGESGTYNATKKKHITINRNIGTDGTWSLENWIEGDLEFKLIDFTASSQYVRITMSITTKDGKFFLFKRIVHKSKIKDN